MISFIVIGYNEGKRIVKCLSSIKNVIEYNNIPDSEIIYVDSSSEDNSIELAISLQGVKVLKVTGKRNAGIGRNIGALEAKGNILCFADGDMELIPDFFESILDENKNLSYKFISGQFENYYYNKKNEFLGVTEKYHKDVIDEDKYQTTTGGLFIIEKELWDKVGGIRTKFKTGEDLDLGLRLAASGYKLLRKKELLAKHHTINYKSEERIWKDLFNESAYPRGLLYRTNFFNKYIYNRIVKSAPTVIALITTSILVFIFKNKLLLILYPAILLLLVIIKYRKPLLLTNVLKKFIYHFLRDILTLLAFCFFYPKNFYKYKYEKIV
jgi:glycosyltransferase involved in cell wall biosynthesis